MINTKIHDAASVLSHATSNAASVLVDPGTRIPSCQTGDVY